MYECARYFEMYQWYKSHCQCRTTQLDIVTYVHWNQIPYMMHVSGFDLWYPFVNNKQRSSRRLASSFTNSITNTYYMLPKKCNNHNNVNDGPFFWLILIIIVCVASPFLRSRNHMTFYSMALGLLELCVPRIFDTKFTKPLQDCLECYMSMLEAYYPRREAFHGITEKFVAFLHLYMGHAPREASAFLAKYRNTLAR